MTGKQRVMRLLLGSKPERGSERMEPVVGKQAPIILSDRLPTAPARERNVMNETDVSGLTNLSGFLGVCLVELESGMTLGHIGNPGFDLEVAAAATSEVLKAELRAVEQLGLSEPIEDMLITLQTQYHLIRIVASDRRAFLYLALDRKTSNLALARMALRSAEEALVLAV